MSNTLSLPSTTSFENVRLIFRNFRGEAHPKYNRDGARSFHIMLDKELAVELESQGYNIRWPKPNPEINPEEDTRNPSLEVTVSRENARINPSVKLFLVDGDNPTRISTQDLAQVDMLDNLMLGPCDVVVSPYRWVMDEGTPHETTGIKAYLSVLYANLRDDIVDPFAEKYGSGPLPF